MSFCKSASCICQLTSYKCLKQFLNKHAANIYVSKVYCAFMTSDPLKSFTGTKKSTYRQSLTFEHNSFLKMCTKVERHGSRATDLHIITGVLFPLLKKDIKIPIYG